MLFRMAGCPLYKKYDHIIMIYATDMELKKPGALSKANWPSPSRQPQRAGHVSPTFVECMFFILHSYYYFFEKTWQRSALSSAI